MLREALRGLHDEHAVRIGARAVQLVDRPAGVEREAAVAVPVGRRGHRRHHPRRLLFEQRREAPEIRRREADVRAGVAQHPLERPEEPRQVVHIRVVEDVAAHREQGAVDAQVLPVVALAERLEELGRLPGPKRDSERVGWPGAARQLHPRSRREHISPAEIVRIRTFTGGFDRADA